MPIHIAAEEKFACFALTIYGLALSGDHEARIADVNRRTRQIDVLARVAMRRVVEGDELFERFRSGLTEFKIMMFDMPRC